jgi:MYXO-CTERM domain-containing protein
MQQGKPVARFGRSAAAAVSVWGLVAWLLAACGPVADGAETDLPAGALQGELTVHIFDLGDRAEVRHTLRLPDDQQRELRFVAPTELPSGVTLRVFGADDGQVVQVSRFEVIARAEAGDLEQSSHALIEGQPKPSKRWAFVLVDTGGGVNISRETAVDRLFSDKPESIRSYYREVSYGLQELSGDVLGPFKVTPPAGGLCQNFVNVAQTLLPMIDSGYTQYLWYIGSRISNCPWSGVAQLGTAAAPTKHSFYNASAECVVLVQEPGHNFGMVHSSSLRCQRGGVAVSMIASTDDGACTHSEYGNPFDPMGGGGGTGSRQMLNRCLHMNGVQKSYQEWLGGCNVVKATTSGRFTLYPLEKTCDGVQVLQVPLPADRELQFLPSAGATLQSGVITSYYVELRAPVGRDSPLLAPRLFIVAAGELREARSRGNPNWLIDTTPETETINDAALAVGKTFSDPAAGGPKITLVSMDGDRAVIEVQLGATGGGSLQSPGRGTCSDDTDFIAPGPDTCLATPGAPDTTADAGPADAGSDAPSISPSIPTGTGAASNGPGSAAALEGGCGCRLSPPAAPAPTACLLLLLAALVLGRRRR